MNSVHNELNTLLNDLSTELIKVLTAEGHLGKPQYDDLLDRVAQMKDVLGTLSTNGNELVVGTVIDNLGLGDRLIALRDAGNNPKQIASILGVQTGQFISGTDIELWLEKYSSLSLLQDPKGAIGSVFDTKIVMQSIFEQLHEHLQKVQKLKPQDLKNARTTKEQIELEVYKEIRALTKDAAAIIESISNMERYKEFQRLIIESIAEVSPEVKHEIMRRLRDQKALFTSLMPT